MRKIWNKWEKWNRWKMTAAFAAAAGCILLSGCKNQDYRKIELPAQAEESGSDHGGEEFLAAEELSTAEKSAVHADITMEAMVHFEERSETVYVNAQNLNIRTEPGTTGAVVTMLSTGAELVRTGYQEEWSRVEYEGQVCYAATRYLVTEKPQAVTAAGDSGSGTSSGAAAGNSGSGSEAGSGASSGAGMGASGADSGSAASGTAASRQSQEIGLNADWKYAGFAKITSGKAVLYRSTASNRKDKVVCVNAGHGTCGGSSVKIQCHPDGTPKVTGGTTGAGATSAVAVSGGMEFADGTAESKVTLALAKVLKDKLLAGGYDVLMIRESDDVQLDNIARTVIANNTADCHIALHWDSTTTNKGAFYMSVPDIVSYRSMEPVASHWQQHHALGDSLIAGLKGAGIKIFSDGRMAMDLTQTSYSTIPSVDIELGDKASDHSAGTLDTLAEGLAAGIESFFGS